MDSDDAAAFVVVAAVVVVAVVTIAVAWAVVGFEGESGIVVAFLQVVGVVDSWESSKTNGYTLVVVVAAFVAA